MEVGKVVTYVDPNGKTQDALVAKLVDGKVNLVVVNADGGEDYFGRQRAELTGISLGVGPGFCCELDAYEPPKEKKETKKKTTAKKE